MLMKLLLPLDRDDAQEGVLVPIAEAGVWCVLDIEEGRVREVLFFADKEAGMETWPEAVVITGEYEPFMEFLEQQMMVLVAPVQRSIDDIVEAFLFKELHEPAY